MGLLLSVALLCFFLVIFVGTLALFWLVKSALGYDNQKAALTTLGVLTFGAVTSFIAGPMIVDHMKAQAAEYAAEHIIAPVTDSAREAVSGVVNGLEDRVDSVLQSASGTLDSASERIEAGTERIRRMRDSLPELPEVRMSSFGRSDGGE